MPHRFINHVAVFAIISAIVWVEGMIVRFTKRWIDWDQVVDAIPYIVFALVLTVVIIGMMPKREENDGSH